MAAPCIIGVGPPRPIGGIAGMPGIMPGGGQPIIGARIPQPIGAICFCAGLPTPRTGPYRPAGTDGIFKGTPRPAARTMPGPPTPGIDTLGRPSSGGARPSTVNDTIFPPCSSTHPKTRSLHAPALWHSLNVSCGTLRNSLVKNSCACRKP